LPLDQLQRKHYAFQNALVTERQKRQQAADLLLGDQKRLVERINDQAARLRQEAELNFYKVVETAVATHNLEEAEAVARRCLADAAETFFAAQYEPFSQGVQVEVTA